MNAPYGRAWDLHPAMQRICTWATWKHLDCLPVSLLTILHILLWQKTVHGLNATLLLQQFGHCNKTDRYDCSRGNTTQWCHCRWLQCLLGNNNCSYTLHPITTKLSSCSGTSRQKLNHQPTIIKQLNIDCHKQLCKALHMLDNQSSTCLGNPAIPVAQSHLSIASKIVCQKSLTALQHAAPAPPYWAYLKQKLHWANHDANNVHWAVLQMSLSSLLSDNQWCIMLFIHDKLLLSDSKAHPHKGSPECPSCQCKWEGEWHFLECTNTECRQLFTKMKHKKTGYDKAWKQHVIKPPKSCK